MTEQSLTAMMRESAERIKRYRVGLGALDPKVDECCKALDELVEYLESQACALTKEPPAH